MFLLDTDSLSLVFRGNAKVRARIAQTPSSDLWLSAIAAEELLKGTLDLINKNRDKPGVHTAYDLLIKLVQEIARHQILRYDEQAAQIFMSFPPQVKRVGPQDCRIAASALSRGWTVVTANQKDFARIPGALFEDWSR